MPSVYPGGLDSWPTDKTNATLTVDDHAPIHNDLADAINKIEAELGIEPSGTAATVKARLDAIYDVIARTNEPATPGSNLLRVYGRLIAGRAMLKGKGPSGLATPYQPALFQNTVRWISPNTTTSFSLIGGAVTSVGTLSHPTPTATSFGYCTNIVSAGTANTAGGTSDAVTPYLRGDGSAGQASGWFFVTRFWIPAAGDLTNSGFIAGMTNATLANMAAAAVPTQNNWAMLSQHDAAGDFRATKFGFGVKSTGTPVWVDTGIVPAINKLYDFYMFSPPYQGAASPLYMRLDNVVDDVTFEHTFPNTEAQLPQATALLRSFVGCVTTEAVAKNIRVKKIYVESDW